MKTLISFFILILFTVRIYSQTDYMVDTRDNQKYKTVTIGEQVWMAENLNFAPSSGSGCYKGELFMCSSYGRLYTWETAKIVCPRGWRLPSEYDFKKLISYAVDEHLAYDLFIDSGSSGFNALLGGMLRAELSFRIDENGINTYVSGYESQYFGDYGFYWSSSPSNKRESNIDGAYGLCFEELMKSVDVSNSYIGHNAFSVRCIKN